MKTIEITRSMTLPVSETMTVPAYLKDEYNNYLIVKDNNLGMFIDEKEQKVNLTKCPLVFITTLNMELCDKDEALKSFNNIMDKFYNFLT
jgi:hypothetical protein